jgi:hypothetical protein
LEDLVGQVNELARAEFPDLGFLDPSGELEIHAGHRAVTALRLELPGTEFFHLTQVLIDAEGIADLARDTDRITSSSWKGYRKNLDQAILFDDSNTETAFHTRREHRPWLEIRFRGPVDISRILLRNRGNRTALRARGIRVLLLTDAGRWTTIYDGAERAAQFARAAEEFHGPIAVAADQVGVPRRSSVAADLVRILTQIHLRDYEDSVVRDLKQIDLGDDDRAAFRSLINKTFLADRELEWTSHGIRRSFRFWSEREKRAYVAFAMELVADLRELTDNVCLGFGSVLSVVRDHDLIPHDDDLDVIIGFEPDQAAKITNAIDLIEGFLRDKGYTVSGRPTAHRLVTKPGQTKVDVFVGIFEGDSISWYPGRHGVLRREMIFPAREVSFLGTDCAVPAHPETYLQQVYGPGWSTPDPNFRHSPQPGAYANAIR